MFSIARHFPFDHDIIYTGEAAGGGGGGGGGDGKAIIFLT